MDLWNTWHWMLRSLKILSPGCENTFLVSLSMGIRPIVSKISRVLVRQPGNSFLPSMNSIGMVFMLMTLRRHLETKSSQSLTPMLTRHWSMAKAVICKSTCLKNYIPAVMSPLKHTSPPSTAATFLTTRLMAVLQPSGYSIFYSGDTPIQLSLTWRSCSCQCLNTETSTWGNRDFTTKTPSISYTISLYIRLVVTL